MYDDDEEIKRKRRNLIFIIFIIIAIIVVLFILLFTRKNNPLFGNGMQCKLQIVNGEKDNSGNYIGNVVVGFESATPESKITKKVVGTTELDATGETYTVTAEGTTTVKGFVYNSSNQVSTCTIPVTIVKSTGKCNLEVTSGTKGESDWYTSDVSVKLNATDTGSLNITKYNISSKGKATSDNKDTYTVNTNGTTELVGTIEYSNGKSTTCDLVVRVDKTKPTCTLKVTEGTKSGNNYTSNVTVVIGSTNDGESGVLSSGFGNKDDFSQKEFKITNNGTTNVVGYVKDKAGNTNTCNLSINKVNPGSGSGGSGSGSGGGKVPTGATVVPSQNKMCSLRVTGTQKNGIYTENVVVSFKEINDGLSNSLINAYGKAGSDQVLITGINSPTQITATATVVYSNGKTANCSITFTVDPTKDVVKYFLRNGKVGDKTNYSAGTWPTSASISSRDGGLGGYRAGASKNNSVSCHTGDSPSKSGWVVYKINGSTVELIHAGVPICMTHTDTAYAGALGIINNSSNASMFVNGYASKAYYLTWSGYGYLGSYGNSLLHNGQYYYLGGANTSQGYASDYLSAYYSTKLWGYDPSKRVHTPMSGTLGLRPIVVLKANVGATKVNGVWNLATGTKAIEDEYTMSDEIFDNIIDTVVNEESLL